MDKRELRKRITEEDALLGNRTISFLLGCGFLMAALGISSVDFEKYVIGALGICVSLIWLSIAWQTRQAITALHNLYEEHFPDDEINQAVFSEIMWKRKIVGTIFGPTELVSFWLPLALLIAWVSVNLNMHRGWLS